MTPQRSTSHSSDARHTRSRGNADVASLEGCFGFDPDETRQHFLVTIPRSNQRNVDISEHYSWSDKAGSGPVSLGAREDGQLRVSLPREKWDRIVDEVRAHLNQRLRKMGRKPGRWRIGQNQVRRELGKELVLLAWAIEDADPALIPNAIANWLGLVPEERWWLYTQTAAASGHGVMGRNKGWRKAVRYALTENPSTEHPNAPRVPEFFQLVSDNLDAEYRPQSGDGEPLDEEAEG